MSGARKFGLVLFGAILVAVFAGIAIANGGVTQPSVPSGDVALVEEVPDGLGDISQEDYDTTFTQTWKRGGLKKAPKPGDAQYDQVRDAALNDLLDQAWLTGEASELGVNATQREVDNEFKTIRKDQFEDDAAYEKFLKDSGFTNEQVLQRVKLQVLSRKIEESITNSVTSVSDEDAKDYFEENKATYATPESRDIRLIVTDDKADADKAATALKEDPSDENFAKLAKKYSTHASKDKGGETVATEGVFPDPAGADIMSAEVDVVAGPVKAGESYYVYKVTKINEASEGSFDEVKDQIKQQLLPTKQQEAMSRFVASYNSKWTARTFCADDYLTSRCHNYEPSGRLTQTDPSTGAVVDAAEAACYEADAADKVADAKQPIACPSLVPGRKVPAPGSALGIGIDPSQVISTLPPQRPVPAGDAEAAAAAGAAAAAAAAAGGAAGSTDPAAAAAAQAAAAQAAAAQAGGQ
ncbi:MAG TPA: peptidyl-prolyl cis-trans isomerase [Solirubrobacterales bacterium]|nr:peptidyl-prolyl cis-trans isomerase [Solirubrobacterales bacterium]